MTVSAVQPVLPAPSMASYTAPVDTPFVVHRKHAASGEDIAPQKFDAINRPITPTVDVVTPVTRATAAPPAQLGHTAQRAPTTASPAVADTPLVVQRKHTKSADIAAPQTFDVIKRASTPTVAVIAPVSRAMTVSSALPVPPAPSIASRAVVHTPLVVQRKHDSGNVAATQPLDASRASASSTRNAMSGTYTPLVIQRKHDSSVPDVAAQPLSTEDRVLSQPNTYVESPTTHMTSKPGPVPILREISKPALSQAIIWRRNDTGTVGSMPVPNAPQRVADAYRPAAIQRQPHDISRSPDSESADIPAPAKTADAPSSGSSAGLVDRVTRSIIKQIAIERERRGGGRWP